MKLSELKIGDRFRMNGNAVECIFFGENKEGKLLYQPQSLINREMMEAKSDFGVTRIEFVPKQTGEI